MKKHIPTMTVNNTAVIIFDTIAKIIMAITLVVPVMNKNIMLTGVCLILVLIMSTILQILKAISLDMMFEIDNKIYLKPRGTRKLQEINIVECLHSRKGDILEWHIDGIVYSTETPSMLTDFFEHNDN